jgi:DNA-binding beta-propeller fold protein YncE
MRRPVRKSVALAFVCGVIAFMIYFWCSRREPPLLRIAGVDVIALPGHPSGVICSPDGNWVFVALTRGIAATVSQSGSGVAVLHKNGPKFGIERLIPVPSGPFGMALTHDGKTLVVATDALVVLLDVGRMTSGAADPIIGKFSDGTDSPIYVNITADDKTLFISNEGDRSISVVDLARVRAHPSEKQAIIGKIPVGEAPIALAFSPDGRWLYTTSEGAPPEWGWPKTEKPEGSPFYQLTGWETSGAVVVVDVARARVDPAHSVVARVPAGDNPVRMVLSRDGRTAYVSARGSNAVLVFDTEKLISDPTNSRRAKVTVGSEPVPVALVNQGTILVVGNSNRQNLSRNAQDTLSLLDVGQNGTKIRTIGRIFAGAFPREMCVSPDGLTLFVSNFRSESLQAIDTRDLPRSKN